MNSSVISSLLGTANLQSQILSSLVMSGSDFDSIFTQAATDSLSLGGSNVTSALSWLMNNSNAKSAPSAGRNMALYDPQSAYNMMTFINNRDVYFKAQFSELSQMGASITHLQSVDQGLESVTTATEDASIKSQLQGFVDEYNNWVQQFNPDVQQGGLLADTQAAKVALYELDQSVANVYNGAKDGMHGLGDLGMSIDPVSNLLTLDVGKLGAALNTNKQDVVDTLQEFSMNFEKSAKLLNSNDNFMPRQLDNLNRAIHYIADNKTPLQAEFGTGDVAKPSAKISQALAAYNQSHS
jgi:hypothetical protein